MKLVSIVVLLVLAVTFFSTVEAKPHHHHRSRHTRQLSCWRVVTGHILDICGRYKCLSSRIEGELIAEFCDKPVIPRVIGSKCCPNRYD